MSSRNNEPSGVAVGAGLIGSGVIVLAILVLIGIAIITAVFTVISIWAWNKPRQIGKMKIEPEEAQGYVYWGFVGFCMMPIACYLICNGFDIYVATKYTQFTPWIGYILGANIFSFIHHLTTEQAKQQAEAEHMRGAKPASLPRSSKQPVPFRYASWDDEVGR